MNTPDFDLSPLHICRQLAELLRQPNRLNEARAITLIREYCRQANATPDHQGDEHEQLMNYI